MTKEEIITMLSDMRDISNLMVDLAYSSVLYGNESIAKEVKELELKVDKMYYDIRLKTLDHTKNVSTPRTLLSVFQIAHAMEDISDSASDIAQVVLKDIDLHPIFKEAVKYSDEIIKQVEIKEHSPLSQKTIGELKIATVTGLLIVAIKRGDSYIYGPSGDANLLEGDRIFVRGPKDGIKKLKKLIRPKDEE